MNGVKRIKTWRLTNPDVCQEFSQEVLSLTEGFDGTWGKAEAIMIQASGKTCRRTKGGKGREKESWRWNDSVEAVLAETKAAYKVWQRTAAATDKHIYRLINNREKKSLQKPRKMHCGYGLKI